MSDQDHIDEELNRISVTQSTKDSVAILGLVFRQALEEGFDRDEAFELMLAYLAAGASE